MTWHPTAPRELQRDLDILIDRNAVAIAQALAGIRVDEPAFALCLWASDDPERCASHLSLGLERDREEFLRESTPWAAAVGVWLSNGTYTFDGIDVPDPRPEAAFLDAETRMNRWLEAEEIEEPSRWMMEEVAYRVGRNPPSIPTTDDFVAFVYDRSEEDLIASLRWTVPVEKQRLLEQKGLLVDELDSLPGAPPEY